MPVASESASPPTRLPLAWLPPLIGLVYGIVCTLWLIRLPQWTKADADEPINVGKARLVRAGFDLYAEIWSDQPPLFTWVLAGFEHVAGVGLTDDASRGRLVVLGFSVMLLTAVCFAARRVAIEANQQVGRLAVAAATLLAAALLIGSAQYLRLSATIMIGLPALSLAMTGMICLWFAGYTTSKARSFALAAMGGGLFAAGLMVKLNVFLLLPGVVALLVLGDRRRWRLAAFTTAAGVVLAACGAALSSSSDNGGMELVDQLIRPHMTTVTGEAPPPDTAANDVSAESGQIFVNLQRIGIILTRDVATICLALLTMVALLRTKFRTLLPATYGLISACLAVVAAALVLLPFASPVWLHHMTIATVPVAIVAACGVAVLVASPPIFTRSTRIMSKVALVATLVIGIYRIAVTVDEHGRGVASQPKYELLQALKSARNVSGTGFGFGDDPNLLFAAGRLPYPEAAVPSLKRRSRGLMSDAMILNLIEENRPDIITLGRFDYGPTLLEAVDRDYERLIGPVPNTRRRDVGTLYIRRDLELRQSP